MTVADRSIGRWQFWIDRGGTFTDIVAKHPDGRTVVHKLLSENPERYTDAAIQGIREILDVAADAPLPAAKIGVVKMGTTVATNALLERKGDRTVLVVTKGFRDALRIGYQNRPNIFARQIVLPEMLYERVVEVEERYSAQGEELISVNPAYTSELQAAYDTGIRSCAIVFMHGYRYPQHEKQVAAVARKIGFSQISVSHAVSPLMKLISRGDTTVVDAYLSPILRRYVNQVASQLKGIGSGRVGVGEESRGVEEQSITVNRQLSSRSVALASTTNNQQLTPDSHSPTPDSPKLMFMQSNGGLADAQRFQGKDSILSGPSGGIVGAVQTSLMAGFNKIISFDMGGTSTDVAHYAGEYERTLETEVAGVRLRTPMMAIHTVAAGGGSIAQFDGARYRVGPESAGANPGPACYRQGGPLTVTDCNIMVGKLQPDLFPKVFGSSGDLPLDAEVVQRKFSQLAAEIGDGRSPERVATGFLAIAVEKMANAIKKISLQRGYDVSEYTLCCFGGAGGQHACLIADALGMRQIFIHSYAGVLSAYGMGLADERALRERAVERVLDVGLVAELEEILSQLELEAKAELNLADKDSRTDRVEVMWRAHLRYEGTDSPLVVRYEDIARMRQQFEAAHRQLYGFIAADRRLIVEAVAVEAILTTEVATEPIVTRRTDASPVPVKMVQMYTADAWHETPVYRREDLQPGDCIVSPAIVASATGTNIVEPGWQAEVTERNYLVLRRRESGVGKRVEALVVSSLFAPRSRQSGVGRQGNNYQLPITDYQQPDPVMLEIFNNLFRAIAEQMGITLQNTSSSVNIKERLDFSCAIFDACGQLVANAPHIPVHLGSMSESVTALIAQKGNILQPGDVYVSNNPYNGGTHLPDITVITPVFPDSPVRAGFEPRFTVETDNLFAKPAPTPIFYVASRGHHADIGGITPGSMPPNSMTVEQEGVLIDNFLLVSQGEFREPQLMQFLCGGTYPVRNPMQNLADLKAQIAANERGVQELHKMVEHYSLETVQAYMGFVQDNAAESVRKVIEVLNSGDFTYQLDNGSVIQVAIAIDKSTRSARIDFTGTSPQLKTNFNAPAAVCKAAVLYVFRTLVDDDIPLNAGCLEPLKIIIPEGCMLNPCYPAAVVAGNVETSQAITDALYGALGVMAAAQGTMNNFTFGSDRHQYYETICGGSGAGADFDGTDAVHTHMTNSRLTDPEVLEWRFPVLLESFSIRPHSGGEGLHRGGNGTIRRLQFLEPMTAAILSGRRVVPPFGLHGGQPGAVGRNYIQRQDGTVEELGSTAIAQMQAGDVFVIETPGGGGFGASSPA